MASFSALSAASAVEMSFDGVPLSQLSGDALLQKARHVGLPRALSDEQQMRIVLASLLQSSGSSAGVTATTLPKATWGELREEAAGLLLLSVRREGCITSSTAAALNVLAKPQVVEKYTTKGNRWTIAEACRDPSVEQAREELGGSGPGSNGEWLRSLGDALDEPIDERPWYTSKVVLAVLSLAFLFVGVHVLLLVRVLMKVRAHAHAHAKCAAARRTTCAPLIPPCLHIVDVVVFLRVPLRAGAQLGQSCADVPTSRPLRIRRRWGICRRHPQVQRAASQAERLSGERDCVQVARLVRSLLGRLPRRGTARATAGSLWRA